MGLVSATASYAAFSALHFVCFALALAVCGLYGRDIHAAHREGEHADSKWVYAVVVGGLSAVTCLFYFVPLVLRHAGAVAAAWSLVLFVLWIAVFGVFGALFIREDAGRDADVRRMKSAVWVDLVSALLWLVSAVALFGYWWRHRDRRSRFTGRAHV